MTTLKSGRSKTLLAASIYVGIIFILNTIEFSKFDLKYFIYFAFFILTAYNIEAIIQLFNSKEKKEIVVWLLVVYIVSILGTYSLFNKIETYYVTQLMENANQVQENIASKDQLDLFKNIIKLAMVWARSFALFGLVKEFVKEKV